jgi:hypothetical protein
MVGQMSLFEEWIYEEDCGNMMAKRPKCECRMPIYRWDYQNPYRFCPYCGQRLYEGKAMQAGRRIYGWTKSFKQIMEEA